MRPIRKRPTLSSHPPVDVCILTVIGPELKAVLKVFNIDYYADRQVMGGYIYWRGSVDSLITGQSMNLAVSTFGDAGNPSAATATTNIIHHLNPSFLVLLGIAAGRRGKCQLGDVVVPIGVLNNTTKVATKSGLGARVFVIPTPHVTKQSLTSFGVVFEKDLWHKSIRQNSPESTIQPEVHESIIASADILLRDEEILEDLASGVHDKVRAGEMEAAGFVIACQARHQTMPWFVVRGVSDYGDGVKDDLFHSLASVSAATYLAYFLTEGLEPRLWGHSTPVAVDNIAESSIVEPSTISPPELLPDEHVLVTEATGSDGAAEMASVLTTTETGLIPSPTPKWVGTRVEGNNFTPENAILGWFGGPSGEDLDEDCLKSGAQAVFDSGNFTDVRLDYSPAEGGVIVILRVLENPVVRSIAISGTSLVEIEKITSLLSITVGLPLNTCDLRKGIEAINSYYNEELGYLLANHVIDLSFSDGELSLDICDGMLVKEIVISGFTLFAEAELEALLSTKIGDFFNRKMAEEDGLKISALYESHSVILSTIRPSISPDHGRLTFVILEAILEGVAIEGNYVVDKASDLKFILKHLRMKPGQILNKRTVQWDLETLMLTRYFKTIEIDPLEGAEQNKVVLVFKVNAAQNG